MERLIEMVASTERDGSPDRDRPGAPAPRSLSSTREPRSSASTDFGHSPSLEKGTPGPETSIGKLFSAPLVEDLADLACSVAGLDAQLLTDSEPDPWLRLAYQARGTSIAGGTTFIQRNIVAERVLSLPR